MTVEDDRIEQLKRKLYSRTGFTPDSNRFKISAHEQDVKDNWEDNTSLHLDEMQNNQGTHPFFKKFLLGAIIFFVVALAVAFYMFFVGANQVSSANVDIQIVGPANVPSGEQVDLGISIINENKVALQDVVLTIEYPEGARLKAESTEPLKRTTENIKIIDKGSIHSTTAKFVLFGDKDVVKGLLLKIEYTVSGSNARFNKEKKYELVIGSSPLLLNVSLPREINSGQEFQAQVSVISNSNSVLKDVVVKAEYPYGFTYKDSSIKVEDDKQTWHIGDLKNGDKKVFNITGSVLAQDNEERTFRFSTGVLGQDKEMEAVLGTSMPTISLKKPFLKTNFKLSGDDSSVVSVKSNNKVSGNIRIENSVADLLTNIVTEVKIVGSVVNKSSIRVSDNGFYQSNQDVIIWDRNVNSKFESFRPGEGVDVDFELSNFNLPKGIKNPEIDFQLTLKAVRSLVGGGIDNVTSVISKKLRFITDLKISTKSLRSGVFTNTGPIPPKRETFTTYTIEWSLSNTFNDVQNAQVKTTLPVYVEWMGNVSPSSESISYIPDSRTVVWNAGTVGANAGFTASSKKVYFQVKLNPSISQVGYAPELIGNVEVSGTDTFVSKTVTSVGEAVTTDTADGFSGVVQ